MKPGTYCLFQRGILTLLILFGLTEFVNAQYCTPTYTIQCGSGSPYINNLSTTGGLTNITNNGTGCGNTSTSYSDYTGNTSMVITQNAGDFISLSIKSAPTSTNDPASSYPGFLGVFVDWNRDGDFIDAGELVGVKNGIVGTDRSATIISFPVPLTAKNGLTRMRVRVASRGSIPEPAGSFSPCANHQLGEVEDYNFEVINPCLPPNNLTISDVNYKAAQIKWGSKANAKLYEYYFTSDKSTLPPTSVGYKYTTDTSLSFDNLTCDTQYYFYLRSVCDTTGPTIFWDTSSWTVDSFRTEPCCYNPIVSIQSITSTTATASWQPIATAYGYEYVISTNSVLSPTTKGTYTTYTSAFLQGLSGSVLYYLHVRSRCAPTPLSGWVTNPLLTQPPLSVKAKLGNGVFDIKLYPNPVSDILRLDIQGIGNDAIVELVDVTGKMLMSSEVISSKVELNVSELPSGMYLLKYHDEQRNELIKVNKQ